MPIPGAALGLDLEPQTVEVTTRMTLAYAAGVPDLGPRTFDDAGTLPLVAPPAFCVRLEWAVLLAGRRGPLGLSETERARAVHVEQDSIFHRPIRPGDSLTTRGRVVTIRSTSAGALVTTQLWTTTAADGTPVVTSWHSSIYRGVGVEGAGGSIAAPLEIPAAPATLEQSLSIPVAREAAHVYTECASIWNPIHSERRVALSQGFPDVILHGTATWAMAGREMVKVYAAGDPTRLKRLRARFRSPVAPGHPITLTHGAGGPGRAHFRVFNHQSQTALDGGLAEF